MPVYVVSPAAADHPAAREVHSHSPAAAADSAYALGIPCSPESSYFVHFPDGDCTEIETHDPDLETIIDIAAPDPAPGQPYFFGAAFPV